MKSMIVVTHLLGTGHLRRAEILARAFADQGHQVLLASGGMPLEVADDDGITRLQLPPLRSDGVNFTRLLDKDGEVADTALLARRRHSLSATVAEFAPDILITELYPFGRRVLADEFDALLNRAATLTPRPVVLASIRDILAPPSSEAKAARTDAVIAGRYDAVLVHSDPQLTPLQASWPVTEALSTKLHYTGYIAPAPAGPHPDGTGAGEILVSAGGGAVGAPLFAAAIGAAALMPDRRWRLLVGGDDAGRLQALRLRAGPNVIVEPVRPDFRQMLGDAAASVSLCGYNTALDVLQAGTPAVFVPFDAGDEREQTLRAESLARLSGRGMLRQKDLTPAALCQAVSDVIAALSTDRPNMRFDGAARSVAIAETLLKART